MAHEGMAHEGMARGMLRPRMRAAAFVMYLLSAAWSCHAVAQQGTVSREYAIKAGVIGVLAKCVTWPDDMAPAPSRPLTIGVLGSDPFVENGINQLDHAVAGGRPIVIKRFASAADYKPCHILFVSNQPAATSAERTIEDRLRAAQSATEGGKTLIVGESSGLAETGVVANMVFDRSTNLIRLEINPDAAARAGLKLAPDLLRLRLVQIVRERPR